MDRAATILTIEDESAIRGGIVAYLEDSGFQMLEADDGPSGVELFRRHRPDVVLCDLRLPGMDGLDVVSTIAADSPETPIIVVSGVSLVSDAVQALKRGAWDFITKPIQDMAVLESAVRRALERAELMRQNRTYREGLETLNRSRAGAGAVGEDQDMGRRPTSTLPEDNCLGEYALPAACIRPCTSPATSWTISLSTTATRLLHGRRLRSRGGVCIRHRHAHTLVSTAIAYRAQG
jgi:CheY-like chemotaxis protein